MFANYNRFTYLKNRAGVLYSRPYTKNVEFYFIVAFTDKDTKNPTPNNADIFVFAKITKTDIFVSLLHQLAFHLWEFSQPSSQSILPAS